jgi:hypothetical protein
MQIAVGIVLIVILVLLFVRIDSLEKENKRLKTSTTITFANQPSDLGLVMASWKEENITYQVVRYVERV